MAKPAAKPLKTTLEAQVFMSDKETEIVEKLLWVKTANPKEDARKALENTDTDKVELIAFSGRGKSFPGLTKAQFAEVQPLVSYRFAKGSGDTLYGATQKNLRKQLHTYVSAYNKIIYDALTTPK